MDNFGKRFQTYPQGKLWITFGAVSDGNDSDLLCDMCNYGLHKLDG